MSGTLVSTGDAEKKQLVATEEKGFKHLGDVGYTLRGKTSPKFDR